MPALVCGNRMSVAGLGVLGDRQGRGTTKRLEVLVGGTWRQRGTHVEKIITGHLQIKSTEEKWSAWFIVGHKAIKVREISHVRRPAEVRQSIETVQNNGSAREISPTTGEHEEHGNECPLTPGYVSCQSLYPPSRKLNLTFLGTPAGIITRSTPVSASSSLSAG